MPRQPDLAQWLPFALSPPRRAIYKRLSANDTGATGGHQVGLYVPNRVAFAVHPALDSTERNPRRPIELRLISHGQTSTPNLIYYNNRRRDPKGTRNECHLTGFGGRVSGFQDPENTGALVVISFDQGGRSAEAWLAVSPKEEDTIEDVLGPVEPGVVGFIGADVAGNLVFFEQRPEPDPCRPAAGDLPAAWKDRFPTAAELAAESARRVPGSGDIDARFTRRHECEYSLFKVVEEDHLLPAIGPGFAFVADFLVLAQSTLQRRKARAGRSLELQLALIFDEEQIEYVAQPETEPGHRPDFVFPSLERYRVASVGDPSLAMLAVKSTLRDRWRQVLREADKIPRKHLLTLDQGVSEAQFQDIARSGIQLVVPEGRIRSFPRGVRRHVQSLATFVGTRRQS
jgi:hypothetical protein